MINISNLSFSYKKRLILSGLNLKMQAGHVYGLLGKNGTGKSTLLHCISGLLYPKVGTVTIMDNMPVSRKPEFLEQIFLLPEEFTLPDILIEKFIKTIAPFYPLFNKEEFQHYLQVFEVPQDNKLQEMSYGQRKKAYISFALACNTSVLLMDEPTNGLDVVSKSQFRKIIAGAVNDNRCIVISTHQMKDLENLIDHVIILDETNILFDQSIESIATNLFFGFTDEQIEGKNVIYKEQSLRGTTYVTDNSTGFESPIDLELLYKSAVFNPEGLKEKFQNNYRIA